MANPEIYEAYSSLMLRNRLLKCASIGETTSILNVMKHDFHDFVNCYTPEVGEIFFV